MKIAYFGSPIFSAALLEKLILDKSLGIKIALVVTQPDKPVGRKMIMTPSPVKLVAQKYEIPVFDGVITSANENNDIFATRDVRSGIGSVSEQARGDKNGIVGMSNLDLNKNLKFQISNLDLCLVYAFGFKQLIPLDLLRAPKMQFEIGEGKISGFVNVHPSLLPLYRGSSPIAYPILLGENKTGVTLFMMDEKMDHGPIITQEEMPITLTDVRTEMEKKLTDLGFEMIKKFLNSLTREPVNSLILKSQPHGQATRSPYMTKDDGFIPLSVLQKALKNEPLTIQQLPKILRNYILKYKSQIPITNNQTNHKLQSPKEKTFDDLEIENLNLIGNWNLDLGNSPKIIYDFWRSMHPWPGLWTLIQPPRFDAIQKDRTSEVKLAGKRLKIIDMEYHVQTGHALSLQIKTVQLEGKSPVDFETFKKAYRLF